MMHAMSSKQAVMLIYSTTDGQRVTDFINPASEHDYMLKKTNAILAEMHIPGVTSHSAIINAVNSGQARVPIGVAWRKREGKDFVEIKARVYA